MGKDVSVDPDGTVEARRKFRKSGNSIVLSVPPQVLQAAGLDEDEEVKISTKLGSKRLSIESLETEEEDEG